MSLSDFKVVKRLGKYNSKNRSKGSQVKLVAHAPSPLDLKTKTKDF